MPVLLVVHHTPSPATHTLLEAVLDGAATPEVAGVETVVRPALHASATDVLDADGYLLGTPANLGYISGALKHFFDVVYYPVLDATRGRPVGCWIHGDDDTGGATAAVTRITTGLAWKPILPVLELTGRPDGHAREQCQELGAVMAATLATI